MPAITKPMLGRGDVSREQKVELGKYIRDLREARGMTQADLAKAVGMNYYTGISAIEVGRNVVPPERVLAFAEALGVNYKTFARKVLQFTNPWVYVALYADDPKAATAALTEGVPDRLGVPRKGRKQN